MQSYLQHYNSVQQNLWYKLLLLQKCIAHTVYHQLILTTAKCGDTTTKKLQVLISNFLTRSFVTTKIATVYQLLRFIVFVNTFQL